MDDQVRRALEKWPDVPAAYGWLRLDRRGRWFLIDRNQPGFDEKLHGKGTEIKNDALSDFIARNYMSDDRGCWFWQNGPQKAYANIDAAPLVLRVMQSDSGDERSLLTHTGYPVSIVKRALIGPDDGLYLDTDLGPGCVHDLDLASLEMTADTISILSKEHLIERTPDVSRELAFEPYPSENT
jgi:hypothetical protein